MASLFAAWTPLSHIHFRGGDLKSNMKLAENEQKLLFVDITARWCHSCKLMEETTFRSPEVVKLINDHYVAIKVDADQIEGKLLAAQENVKVLPALIVMDARGNRLDMINQAPSEDRLTSMLKSHVRSRSKQRRVTRSGQP